jgi:hypothetical protein
MAKGKEAAPVAAAASTPRDGPVIVGVVAEEGAKASASPALLKLHLAAKLAGKDLPVESRTLPAAGTAFGSSGASLERVFWTFFDELRLNLLPRFFGRPAFLDVPNSPPIFDANAAVRYLFAGKESDPSKLGALDTWTEFESNLQSAVAQGGAALENALDTLEKDAVS